jgi:superfamily II DNA or RNA helicase
LYERKGLKGPHLIVCPKAVLPNWAAEFAAWAPDLDVILYDGRPDERAMLRGRVLAGNGGRGFCALLTHYDLILRDKAVLAKPHWSYIIVDEGHRMKNHESRLAEVLAASYRSKHRLLLTGTPIQNNMGELWALLNFLLPAIFHSAESFQSWFNAPFAGTKEDIILNDEEELVVINRLHAVLRPFLLRRRKAEVESQLPAKVEVVLKADMSAWQRHYYKSIVEEKRVETSAGGASLMNGAMQLRKCCNHPYLFLGADGYEPTDPNELIRASGKLELLHRILPKLKASGHRVLLFSQMTQLLNILEDYLAGRGYSYLRLDGNTGTAARAELLASFNAPDSPHFLFLLSTRAGGMGLNLQSADTVIMFDSDWNPQADAQAEDRAHRIGQRREVRVIVMVSVGSIEEVILARARAKRAVDAKVIQAGMFNGRSSADDRRAMLAQIFSGGGLGGRGLDGASVVTGPAELNALIARSEEEVEMFEAMDAASPPLGLISQEELPEWVTAAPARDAAAEAEAEAEAEALATGVRRKRQARQGVTYADGLSDAKWLKIVDSGGDLDALKLAADRSGKRRRSGSRRRSSRGDGDDDTPPAKRGRRGSARRGSGRKAGRAAAAAPPPPRHGRATRANAGRNGDASGSDDGDESDDEASGSESESGSSSGDESGSDSGEEGGAEEGTGTPTPAADASPE